MTNKCKDFPKWNNKPPCFIISLDDSRKLTVEEGKANEWPYFAPPVSRTASLVSPDNPLHWQRLTKKSILHYPGGVPECWERSALKKTANKYFSAWILPHLYQTMHFNNPPQDPVGRQAAVTSANISDHGLRKPAAFPSQPICQAKETGQRVDNNQHFPPAANPDEWTIDREKQHFPH